MSNETKDQKSREDSTAFAKMLKSVLNTAKIEIPRNEIPVEYFAVLFDSIYNFFYEKNGNPDGETAFQRITNVSGIKIQFDKTDFPYSKKDKSGENYRIIVLPDNGDSIEKKNARVFDAIKEFDCLEAIGIYQLTLTMLNSYLYHPKNLIDFVQKHDPNPNNDEIHLKKRKELFDWLTENASRLNSNGED